jgi:hypothetical protein
MTVKDLIALLRALPPDAEVCVQFDVSDHDTLWALTNEARTAPDAEGSVRVVLVAR